MTRPSTERGLATRYVFVRHGETEWNRNVRFRGRADIPLNDTGRQQARLVADRLAHHPLTAVYSSPLARTMDTARAIAAPHGLEVIANDLLLDLHYGDWQGKTPEEVEADNPKRYATWLSRPARARIPGAERLASLRRRVVQILDHVAAHHPGATVALVSHDMVGRVLMTVLLNLPLDAIWQIAQDNAALNVFEKQGDQFRVLAMNDTGHLDA